MTKKLISGILAMILLITGIVLPVSAKSSDEDKLKKKLSAVYEECSERGWGGAVDIQYSFADINGDGSKEMLCYDKGDPWSYGYVFGVVDGKAKKIISKTFHMYPERMSATNPVYYKKSKVIRVSYVYETESIDYYMKWTGKKYKVKASHSTSVTGDDVYKIGNKTVTKKKYTKYVKKLRGSGGKKVSSLKWKSYEP